MNSEVTLTDYSAITTFKGQVRLLFKRGDPHHAVLLEEQVPRYFLTTSDGLNKVKIRDANQRVLVDVNRRVLLKDVFTFAERNGGKALQVENLLRRAPATAGAGDDQLSIMLHTEEGAYHWRKQKGNHWALYENPDHNPVAWTETVPGSPPTWELVSEARTLGVLDYILDSLFYLKSSHSSTEAGRVLAVDHRVAKTQSAENYPRTRSPM